MRGRAGPSGAAAPTAGPLRDLGPAIYLPSLLFGIGQGAIVPVIALSALERGASVAVAAVAVAALGVGRILGDLPAGMLVERIGERRSMLVATAMAVAALTTCVFGPSVWLLCCGLVAVGTTSSVWGLARQAYITDVMPYEYRGRALSTLGGMQRIGLVVGPLLAAAAMGPLGIAGAYWIHVAAAALAAALLLLLPEPDASVRSGRRRVPTESVVTIVRRHRRLFATIGVGTLMISAVRSARQVLVPLWADHIGLSPAATSLLYGLTGVVEMVMFYPGGLAMDRFGRRPIVVAAMLGLGLPLVALPFTSTVATLAIAATVMALANGLGSGMNMTIGADVSPAQGRSTFLGAWRLCMDAGNGMGPVAVGVITAAAALGPAAMFMGGVAGLAALLLGRWLPRTGRAASAPVPVSDPSTRPG